MNTIHESALRLAFAVVPVAATIIHPALGAVSAAAVAWWLHRIMVRA